MHFGHRLKRDLVHFGHFVYCEINGFFVTSKMIEYRMNIVAHYVRSD